MRILGRRSVNGRLEYLGGGWRKLRCISPTRQLMIQSPAPAGPAIKRLSVSGLIVHSAVNREGVHSIHSSRLQAAIYAVNEYHVFSLMTYLHL